MEAAVEVLAVSADQAAAHREIQGDVGRCVEIQGKFPNPSPSTNPNPSQAALTLTLARQP